MVSDSTGYSNYARYLSMDTWQQICRRAKEAASFNFYERIQTQPNWTGSS